MQRFKCSMYLKRFRCSANICGSFFTRILKKESLKNQLFLYSPARPYYSLVHMNIYMYINHQQKNPPILKGQKVWTRLLALLLFIVCSQFQVVSIVIAHCLQPILVRQHCCQHRAAHRFCASCLEQHTSQQYLCSAIRVSVLLNPRRQLVMEVFCSTSTERSRKSSSLLLT